MDFSVGPDGPVCMAAMRADGDCCEVPLERLPTMAAWVCPRCGDTVADLFVARAKARSGPFPARTPTSQGG